MDFWYGVALTLLLETVALIVAAEDYGVRWMATEKRMIDTNEIEKLFYKQVEYGATDLMDAFDDALQDAQTVDAVEVVRGEWTIIEDDYCGLIGLECSHCEKTWWFDDESPIGEYHFFPDAAQTCESGKETVVRGYVLRRGTTNSCGCGKGLKHGHFHKPWYRSYKSMMERCYLPTNGNYKRYGGKGVTVCEEWHDINKFAEWVESSGYTPGLTIDRIDPSGNYEPNNCQWLTRSENSKKSFEDRKKKNGAKMDGHGDE